MRPIAILQHEAEVAPGNFEQHLRALGRPFELVRLHAGDTVPASAAPFGGICTLGGNMSVRSDDGDALPWLDPELALLRDADTRGVPVIGHCLGGQLLARAFGAAVTRSPNLELGWGRVQIDDLALAHDWLGADAGAVEFFQWHGDAFDLPPGARRLLRGEYCANQAFVLERPGYAHVGMQFHIEMTPELVRSWVADPAAETEGRRERARTGGPAVQSPAAMLEQLELRAAQMARVAARLYDRWLQGVRG